MKTLYTVVLASTITLGACTKKDDEESSATAAEEETKTSAITTGSGVMAAIGDTLGSLGTAAPGTLVIAPGLRLDTHASANPLCSEHGTPLKDGLNKSKGDDIDGNDQLDESDPSYAAKFFFCLSTLTFNDGASVETLLGQIGQAQAILCSFEKGFGSFEYTTDGTDLINGTPKDVTLDSECWPGGTPDGLTTIKFVEGTAKALDESTGYQKDLSFVGEFEQDGEVGQVSESLQFFNKDGVIGFKKISDGTAPGVGGYSEFVLNTNTGVVLVNTVDDRGGGGGADSAYRRVVRLKVEGEIDDKLAFTGLTALQGIFVKSTNDLDNYAAQTIKGDKTNGFYGQSGKTSSGTYADTYKGCTGAKSDCTTAEIDDLVGDAAKFTTFYNSRAAWTTHLASGLPPCDDGKDLSFDAVPATGAYGVCE